MKNPSTHTVGVGAFADDDLHQRDADKVRDLVSGVKPMSKKLIKDYLREWRTMRSDSTKSWSDRFLIDAINAAIGYMCQYPGIGEKLFKYHKIRRLDVYDTDGKPEPGKHDERAWRWNLIDEDEYSSIIDITLLQIYEATTEGERLLPLCYLEPDEFYARFPMIYRPPIGTPKFLTYDSAGDDSYVAMDKIPANQLMLSMRFTAYPKRIASVMDRIPISRVAWNAVMDFIDIYYFKNSMDYAFADATYQNIDKSLAEIRQRLNRKVYGKPYVMR